MYKAVFEWIAVELCWISVEVSTCLLHSKFMYKAVFFVNCRGTLLDFCGSFYMPITFQVYTFQLYKALFLFIAVERCWIAVERCVTI